MLESKIVLLKDTFLHKNYIKLNKVLKVKYHIGGSEGAKNAISILLNSVNQMIENAIQVKLTPSWSIL